jgi:hypothetical protein
MFVPELGVELRQRFVFSPPYVDLLLELESDRLSRKSAG